MGERCGGGAWWRSRGARSLAWRRRRAGPAAPAAPATRASAAAAGHRGRRRGTCAPGSSRSPSPAPTPGQPLTLYGTRRPQAAHAAGRRRGPGPLRLPAAPSTPPSSRAPTSTTASSTWSGGTTVEPGRYAGASTTAPAPAGQRRSSPSPAATTCPTRRCTSGQELTGARLDVARQPRAGVVARGRLPVPGDARRRAAVSAMVRFPDEALYGPGPVPDRDRVLGLRPVQPGHRGGRRPHRPGRSATPRCRSTCGARGCSGGVFDVFNPAQMADGYDVVETVARQAWVRGGQGRHGRPVLLGHHPALHGRHQPAAAWPPSRPSRSSPTRGCRPGPAASSTPASPSSGSRSATRPVGPRRHQLGARSASRPATRPAPATWPCATRTPTSRAWCAASTSVQPRRPRPATCRCWCATSRRPCSSPAPSRTSRPARSSPPCSTTSSSAAGAAGQPVERPPPRRLRARRTSAAGSSSWSCTSPTGCRR